MSSPGVTFSVFDRRVKEFFVLVFLIFFFCGFTAFIVVAWGMVAVWTVILFE